MVKEMIRFKLPRKLDGQGQKSYTNAEKTIESGLSPDLQENISLFQKLFNKDNTLILRRIENKNVPHLKCCLIGLDGMVDINIINENVIRPIVCADSADENGTILDFLEGKVIEINNVERSEDVNKLLESLLYGDSLLFADGCPAALILNTKGWQTRAIEEPEFEKVFVGPREGFTESLLVNLSMVRRRILSSELKLQFRTFGTRTKTKACICYMEGLAHQEILDELQRRLDSVDLDGILDQEYIREFITDAPYSAFNTMYRTERPDTVAGKLLEGRIALLIDGSPAAITLPCLFVESIQTNEDYYLQFYSSSFNRILRIITLFITTCLPALYLCVVAYHQELIPTKLLLSIAASRSGIPFPTVIEMLALLLVFEILRESGTRMPTNFGQAFSIVGALVLGQAAVEAKFVSSAMVIIIATTGITSLMLPKMVNTILIYRIVLILISAVLGFFGFILVFSAILAHVLSLRSFGVPYMTFVATFEKEDIRDTVLRMPWYFMNFRPKYIASDRKRKTQKDNRS